MTLQMRLCVCVRCPCVQQEGTDWWTALSVVWSNEQIWTLQFWREWLQAHFQKPLKAWFEANSARFASFLGIVLKHSVVFVSDGINFALAFAAFLSALLYLIQFSAPEEAFIPGGNVLSGAGGVAPETCSMLLQHMALCAPCLHDCAEISTFRRSVRKVLRFAVKVFGTRFLCLTVREHFAVFARCCRC